MRLLPLLAALALLAPAAARASDAAAAAPAADGAAHETKCWDGVDEDNDTVTDCGDADCFAAPECQPGGKDENTEGRCSNWVDDDGDTLTDCDDPDCEAPGLNACKGSMDQAPVAAGVAATTTVPADALKGDAPPPLDKDPETLIGSDGDLDGERSNEVCGDGIDNDGDGRTDCQDFGCRYDPSVTICQAAPGMRFSVVVGATVPYLQKRLNDQYSETISPTIDRLQLRALGPMPLIANSFFLISIRSERTVRNTFAMFQVPLGNQGHYLNINTGGGGLSSALVTSTANQLLLDPANYVYKAFEQANGIATEVGGPLLGNTIRYRAFLAGGSGATTGNIGGSYFSPTADRNLNWSAGGQLQFNLVGSFSRFDSPFLYTPVPLTVGALVGARYDQRTDERFPAMNTFLLARYGHFVLSAENYTKRELNFGSWQTAYVVQAGVLLVPKRVMLAADFGQLYATPWEVETSANKLQNEWQGRAALHFYFFKNIGLISLLYKERHQQPRPDQTTIDNFERQFSLEMQYRY